MSTTTQSVDDFIADMQIRMRQKYRLRINGKADVYFSSLSNVVTDERRLMSLKTKRANTLQEITRIQKSTGLTRAQQEHQIFGVKMKFTESAIREVDREMQTRAPERLAGSIRYMIDEIATNVRKFLDLPGADPSVATQELTKAQEMVEKLEKMLRLVKTRIKGEGIVFNRDVVRGARSAASIKDEIAAALGASAAASSSSVSSSENGLGETLDITI